MTWDHPLSLLLALSLPLIILLHLLARRRKTVTVPSLVLWERLLENERRSVSLRRLIADILLLLQLLTAAFLVLALAGPRPEGRSARMTSPTVLVIDISAGMSAREAEGGTRFDLAIDAGEDLIRHKAPRVDVMIIAAGSRAIPVTGFVSDRSQLLSALRNLRPSDEPGDPRTVVRTAEALAAARTGGRTVFITDGAFDDEPPLSPRTEILRIGTPLDNLGITLLAVRALSGGGRELLVTVENHGHTAREATLSIDTDGRPLLKTVLDTEPARPVSRTVSWNDSSGGIVTARLEQNGGDALGSDDTAAAVLVPGGRIRTILFSSGNWFLETLLETHPNLELTVVRDPENWSAGEGGWDLMIADRVFPTVDPGLPLLAVYPFGDAYPAIPVDVTGFFEGADPVRGDPRHPVTRDVDLDRISVGRAVRIETGPGVRTLIEAASGPLLIAGEDESRRWSAFTFDLLDSSLPLRPAFPILIAAELDWLTSASPDSAAEMRRTGETWILPPDFRDAGWKAEAPDGRVLNGTASGRPMVDRLDRAGIWRAVSADREVKTGVNLLSPDETNLIPRRYLAGPAPVSAVPGVLNDSTAAVAPLTVLFLILSILTISAEWLARTGGREGP